MPRKQDPKAVEILKFFETAPLEVAVLMLQLAKGSVDARLAKQVKPAASAAKVPVPPKRPSGTMPAGAAKPIVMPEPKAPPAPAAKPRTKAKTASATPPQPPAAVSGNGPEVDVPLPGLPGVVPVVGG